MACGKCGNNCAFLKKSDPATPQERIARKLDRIVQLMGHLQEWRTEHPNVVFPLRKHDTEPKIVDLANLRRQVELERRLKLGLIVQDPSRLDDMTYEDLGNI
ncbi:MAG: hypothetical protein V1854_05910 [Methanobacteriota archaeon]